MKRIAQDDDYKEEVRKAPEDMKAFKNYQDALPVCVKSGSDMDLGFIYVLLAENFLIKSNVEYKS